MKELKIPALENHLLLLAAMLEIVDNNTINFHDEYRQTSNYCQKAKATMTACKNSPEKVKTKQSMRSVDKLV